MDPERSDRVRGVAVAGDKHQEEVEEDDTQNVTAQAGAQDEVLDELWRQGVRQIIGARRPSRTQRPCPGSRKSYHASESRVPSAAPT